MHKKIVLMILCVLCAGLLNAQSIVNGNTEQTRELYAKAKSHLAKRDYSNAILVYNQLARLEPENIVYRREMAHTYYLMRDFKRAIQVVTPLMRKKDADEQVYLTAGQIFNKRGFTNQAFSSIERGLKRFPNSGPLYSEYGKYYLERKKHTKAEAAWEKGVQKDPNYYLNYYNLAKSYYKSKKPLWAILYGETFINMERFSARTEEVKEIVFASYKQLIANNQLHTLMKGKKSRRKGAAPFEKKVNELYAGLSHLVMGGVDVDNVVMLRTRFLLNWMQLENEKYPYALFRFQNKLLSEGLFESYNQWLFGKAASRRNFVKWVSNNKESYETFEKKFSEMKFRNKPDQYYK